MSDNPTPLDLEQVLAQLARSRAETEKFVAERDKLLAEAGKLSRDRFLAPLALALTGVGTGAALFAAAQAFLRMMGT